MDISRALRIIKKNLRKNVLESEHFKKQCQDRELDRDIIQQKVQRENILGIVEQNRELYKVWFSYQKHKDLNIIIKIRPNNRLRFVTVFPCYSERRIR